MTEAEGLAELVAKSAGTGEIDLATLERDVRNAVLAGGSRVLCRYLSEIKEETLHCPDCDQAMSSIDVREKEIVSLLGYGQISRGYYECPNCGRHKIPKDDMLGIVGTAFTPGVRRAASILAATDSFEAGSFSLSEFCGVHVTAKQVERISERIGTKFEGLSQKRMVAVFKDEDVSAQPLKPPPIIYVEYDGTGVPVRKSETKGRKGKQAGGGAKTREMKTGCVFTQSGVDDKGKPVRDKGSSTYFGAIEPAEEFGKRVFAEAMARGVEHAGKVVVIGDGAKWIWNIADTHFPGATQIIDLYHAKEHVHDLLKQLSNNDGKLTKQCLSLLEAGKIKRLIRKFVRLAGNMPDKLEAVEDERSYFEDNIHRMQYSYYKSQGLFVGSGAVEAACKNVIGKRLKQSGMHWSVAGANSIAALRCAHLSGYFDEMFSQAESCA